MAISDHIFLVSTATLGVSMIFIAPLVLWLGLYFVSYFISGKKHHVD